MNPAPVILILAATKKELQCLEPHVRGLRPRRQEAPGGGGTDPQSFEFRSFEVLSFEGQIGSHHIAAAETGTGKSNAAMACFDLLGRLDARAALCLGCAGAFRPSGLSIGDVVIADREVFADEGAASPQGFLDLRRLGLPLARGPDGQAVYNVLPAAVPEPGFDRRLSGAAFQIKIGTVATVSTCSGTEEAAEEIYRRWQPLAEAMEGAAAALAALRRRRPFLEVRGISNFAGQRDRQGWDIDTACARAAAVAAAIIEAMGRDMGRDSQGRP
ncbi:MAG: futalosine hydrolase [Planctomycetes bacterium]|nr:futalosine hydrolase [Planctomycetota bacterium]